LAAGAASLSSAATTARGSRSSLRIVYSDPRGLGRESFRLSCSPAVGTIPDPSRACAEIAGQPLLVRPGPRYNHSCPAREPFVEVIGKFEGSTVETGFSPCASTTPEGLLTTWLSLLPTTLSINTRRGLGPVLLGERRSAVAALLGTGQRVSSDEVVYPLEAGSYRSPGIGLGLRYGPTDRVVEIVDDSEELTLDQENLATALQARSELARRLAHWKRDECDGFAGRSLGTGDGRATILLLSERPVAIVTNASDACPTARRLLHSITAQQGPGPMVLGRRARSITNRSVAGPLGERT
jgi:hypothetical protein